MAGKNGQLCKHRLAILNGDAGAVVSDNKEMVRDVASWLEGSNIAGAIAEVILLEDQKKQIEEKIKNAKKLLAKALL